MKIYTIETGYFKLDGGAMFGVVPKTIWNKINPADENNLCNFALRSLLIEDENKLILVDTGIGNKLSPNFLRHYYLSGNDSLEKSLLALGYYKENITDVIMTHFHFDHCGGSVEENNKILQPTFPNANYWCSNNQWESFLNPNEREKSSYFKDNIIPLQEANKLKIINPTKKSIHSIINEFSFSSNITLLEVNGHSQGMLLPKIHFKENCLVFLADLIPTIGHISIPYVMGYDMNPLLAMNEKKELLNGLIEGNNLLMFQHDPLNECCTIKKDNHKIVADKILKLKDWVF